MIPASMVALAKDARLLRAVVLMPRPERRFHATLAVAQRISKMIAIDMDHDSEEELGLLVPLA